MKKTRAQRRRERAIAFAILYTIELLVAVGGGALVAVILLPLAYAERGKIAFGGEWLAILLAVYGTYCMFHNWVYEKIGG